MEKTEKLFTLVVHRSMLSVDGQKRRKCNKGRKTESSCLLRSVRARARASEKEEREMGGSGFVMARRIWKLASILKSGSGSRSVFASGNFQTAGYSSSSISFGIQALSPYKKSSGSGCGGLQLRSFAASVNQEEHNKIVDEINAKFAEAREEIELAMESKETVYFDEEAESARAAVRAVLDAYEGLIERLDETERGALQRSMGLKMEQLKAELQQLNE